MKILAFRLLPIGTRSHKQGNLRGQNALATAAQIYLAFEVLPRGLAHRPTNAVSP